ncbi:metal-dependent transcriptional regulator [Rhodohalobacter sp. SW132]|uniref:metal-dependent transcriptional regulator n=1 Tax=Rhodohalobacter sp. SW132 TaxID=2293433 RepID=UPI000E21EFAE|nr:metal-dependent transcriptional regulator [Rhodohalobacter sp. SW132]REL37612.1 metal-dependent transcriptional regulator [Rhodohalobacter sp. SW132]
MSRSQSVEDYLKAIYKLELNLDGKGVPTSELAREMGVANASVTNMVKRLSELGMATHQSYYGTKLTESGKKIALEMIRHHRLLELYLAEMLGYSWDQVHDEAEKLEHHISEQFEDRISELLDDPKFDPHGDPIPSKDGKIPRLGLKPLSEINESTKIIVKRVKNQDPELLRYLHTYGLTPGSNVKVIKKEPFDGPLELLVDGKTVTLGHNIAEDILVVYPGESKNQPQAV